MPYLHLCSAAPPILLNKVSDTLTKLHSLVEKNHNLNDSMIIKITMFTLPIVFVEGLSNLQLNSMLVIRSVCNSIYVVTHSLDIQSLQRAQRRNPR